MYLGASMGIAKQISMFEVKGYGKSSNHCW